MRICLPLSSFFFSFSVLVFLLSSFFLSLFLLFFLGLLSPQSLLSLSLSPLLGDHGVRCRSLRQMPLDLRQWISRVSFSPPLFLLLSLSLPPSPLPSPSVSPPLSPLSFLSHPSPISLSLLPFLASFSMIIYAIYPRHFSQSCSGKSRFQRILHKLKSKYNMHP